MAGEGLAAQDEEEPDGPREHGGDAGGGEGRAHEVVLKHGRRRGRGHGCMGRVVAVRLALDVDVAGHDEIAVPDPHDLDLRAVEARQHRAGHDLLDRADHRAAAAQIEHPVDGVDERVELVGAEQDRDLEVVADAPGDLDHALLVGGIERDQRLVEQKKARAAEQRLAEQHPLPLAPRQFADRAAGEIPRPHLVERPVDLAPRRLVERREAEPPPDRGARHHVPAGEPEAAHRGAVLRHVADRRVAARGPARRARELRLRPGASGRGPHA